MKLHIESVSENNNLVKVLEPLSVDDFDIAEKPSVADSTYFPTTVRSGVLLTLKQDVLEEILSAAGIKHNNGRFTGQAATFGLTDGWKTEPSQFGAMVSLDVSYRGLRNKEAKINRALNKSEEANKLFESKRDKLISKEIQDINSCLSLIFQESNKATCEVIEATVVDLNVDESLLAKVVTKEESLLIETKSKAISDIDEQINALRDKQKAIRNELYVVKRKVIEREVRKTSGEITTEFIDSLPKEKPEQQGFILG